MRKSLPFVSSLVLLASLMAGCSGMEQKMGRGISNATEIVRLNEMNRSMEQGGLFYGPNVGITTGFVHGFDRTLARTGVGVFEILTFPFPIPTYGPIWTNYLSPKPQFPDTYSTTEV
jgi:putative exosortase-associated protein (TIGR04073 family)